MIKKLSAEPEEILDNSTELRYKILTAAAFKKNNELLKDLTNEEYYDEYDEANFNPIINIRFKRSEDTEHGDADNSTEIHSEEEMNSEAEDNNTIKMASKEEKKPVAGNKRPRSNKTNVLKRTRKMKSNRSLRKSNRRRNRRRRLRKNRS